VASDRDPFGRRRHPVEHGRGRAGEQTLGRAVADGLGEPVAGKGEGEDRRSRSAVGGGGRFQQRLDANFGIAADHARAVAAGGCRRGREPVFVVRGDDQPGMAQPEGLGEGGGDSCGTDVHANPISIAGTALAGIPEPRICYVEFQKRPTPIASALPCPPPPQGLPPMCRRHFPHRVLSALLLATAGLHAAATAADPPGTALEATGVAIAPRDAAFFSASLRLREQWQRIENSNAYARIRRLPAVQRALDSLEEQRTMPGSPLSMVDTFMSLPENVEARALLADMVASDTFVYGEPSCIAFVQLVKKLQRAQQAVAILSAPGIGEGLMLEEETELFDEEVFDDDDEPEARAGRVPVQPVRLRADVDDDDDVDERGDGDLAVADFDGEQLQKRMLADVLVKHLDLLVVPDIVWGFRTTKAPSAKAQLARLEALGRLLVQMNPEFEKAIERQSVAGGEFLVVTLAGDQVPWQDLQEQLAGDIGPVPGLDRVFERLASLRLVVALGQIGDRVILSVGGSLDHLAKLALPAGARPGLLTTKPFAPLREHADKPITGISYLSGEMAAEFATRPGDVQASLEAVAGLAAVMDVSAEVTRDVQAWLAKGAEALARRLPDPGPWLGYSFMTPEGYEGYAWDWSDNQPFDSRKRLDLLEHAGGAPLAVAALRFKSDPQLFDEIGGFLGRGLDLVRTHGLPGFDADDFDQLSRWDEALAPVLAKAAAAFRDKLGRALADGQVGFAIDAKAKGKRPHRDLPAATEPLPLLEPAIVLPLADPKLFREGLSDLFALSDELVATLRRLDPDAVRPGYRVPDPEREKVEGGSVWSFPLPNAGLDEQVRPAIGIGENVVVLSLVPRQAARMLGASRLETGSGVTNFEEPLARAAAIDVPGVIDALRPWILYGVRYGCVMQRDGRVGPDDELGADVETEQVKEALHVADVVLEAAKCFRTSVATSTVTDEAHVTHWRNVIRDLPAQP